MIANIVEYAPKPYSHYHGPYISPQIWSPESRNGFGVWVSGVGFGVSESPNLGFWV